MGVVLRESAHSGEAVEFAALLVAVHCAKFGKAQRQVAVRTRQRAEYLAVVRTVHRFEQVFLAFLGGVDRLERVLAILGIVAGGDVELLVAYVRGDYLLVAVAALYFTEELLQAVTKSGALGQPERKTGAHALREREKLHLLAKLAVVALLGLFEQREVFVEHRLFRESDAIHAHKLVALLVAAPVCTCKRCYLHGLYRSRGRDMRATAKVGKRSLGIGGDAAVFKFGYKFALIFLATVAEKGERVGLGYVGTDNLLVTAGELGHLGLDLCEIV